MGHFVPYCPPWRAIWDGRPILPSLEGNMGRPPALGKKEGGEANLVSGRAIWDAFDQNCSKMADFFRHFESLFFLIAGKRGCGLRLFHSDFRLVQANGVVDLDFFTVILDLSRVDLDFFAGFVGRRGGSKFGLREGKLAPFWRRGGGVSNEGLLDLMSVDLVFSGFRADISGKIDLSCVDLDFFAGFAGKQAVDLDFFAVSLSVRLVQANGTVDLVFFAVRLSVRLVQANGTVDLVFFAVRLSVRLVQANGVVDFDFFAVILVLFRQTGL